MKAKKFRKVALKMRTNVKAGALVVVKTRVSGLKSGTGHISEKTNLA